MTMWSSGNEEQEGIVRVAGNTVGETGKFPKTSIFDFQNKTGNEETIFFF